MNKPLIVWDLFGGGMNSIHKALADDDRFKVYTFDIMDTFETTNVIDLSQNIADLIDYFNDFPKPDIITASPLCMSFSLASAMPSKDNLGKGNACWRVMDGKLVKRQPWEYENTRYEYETQHAKAELGEKCLNNTMALIDSYQPKAYYVENPLNSLMFVRLSNWRPLDFEISVNYGDYGFIAMKPTKFKTNVNMSLKPRDNKKIYGKGHRLDELQGMERSGVPADLIKDIFNCLYKYVESEKD